MWYLACYLLGIASAALAFGLGSLIGFGMGAVYDSDGWGNEL